MVITQAIAGVLGLPGRMRTVQDLDSAVARGLSKDSVTRVVARLSADSKQARSLRDRVIPLATWKRTKGRLSAHLSERTERLARVLAAAEYTWDDTEQARLWMNAPHPELGGRTPVAAAATELGARAVEDLLDRLFYGLPA